MIHVDQLFPLEISFGSRGGPRRNTRVVTSASGAEQRLAMWARSRRSWDVAWGIRSLDDVQRVVAFHEAMGGRFATFLFKDPADHKSCDPSGTPLPTDQLIGQGDGETASFQLAKAYQVGGRTYLRPITRPSDGSLEGKASTMRVAVDGEEKTEGEHFTVDYATGLVTFTEGNEPADEAPVTAGFEFYVRARFDADELASSIDSRNSGPGAPFLGAIDSILLVEVPDQVAAA